MDHGGGMSGMATAKPSYTHMTFFWGKNSEILFAGWPGSRGGMYALALVVVFALAILLEWIHHCRLVLWLEGAGKVAAGLAQTAQHAVRIGLAYLLMLAVMSFNGGLFIVVVFGHALGFLFFGSSVFRKSTTCGDVAPLPSC
ncbi:copper transporter 6-like [Canna indica]|uniref:Copper transport protein n=1 Tax=Canna indica TaxID=4628 RepID=A0AAQ3KQP4_9LILI|nr:copper transporter 6-like [Canna indica]